MAIDYDKIMSLKSTNVEYSYTDNDTMLYALGDRFWKGPIEQRRIRFCL